MVTDFTYTFIILIMAKVTSIVGTAVGKLGSVVYSVSGGQMVARAYQPNVTNPNTNAQVDQRARFKLQSQIAAALAPVIVIPKQGLQSSRNLFIKKNSDLFSVNSGVAQISYENLQLTNGSIGIPAIDASRDASSGITIQIAERVDTSVDRVVYILYKKTSEQTLQYVQSVIAEAAGSAGTFPATMLYVEGDIVLFAYGMRDLNAKAKAKYDNYKVSNGHDIATLLLQRSLNSNDYQFTQTRGTTMFSNESSTISVPEGYARVFLTPSGPGSVSGAGVFEIGQNVTVVATPNEGMTFVGWRWNGSNTNVSTATSYTFELAGQVDLIAVFRDAATPSQYSITVESSNESLGSVAMEPASGDVRPGDSITLRATIATGSGATFQGWYDRESGSRLSQSNPYTFIPTKSLDIEGRFGSFD